MRTHLAGGKFRENDHDCPPAELKTIVKRSADILNVEIDDAGAEEIALRSRGTPRIANRILKRVRDFAQIQFSGSITGAVADAAIGQMEIDRLGLDDIDKKMITAMIKNFGGGPVGLETLSATIGEEANTIEDVYEPYLIQIGFVNRTSRGRVVTEKAYEHLKIPHSGTLF